MFRFTPRPSRPLLVALSLAMLAAGVPTAPAHAALRASAPAPGVAVGDLNGDGADDVAVGAVSGGLRIVWGHADPYSVKATDPGFVIAGASAAGRAGDLDGDGFDDLAVDGRTAGGSQTVTIVYGAASTATVSLAAGPRVMVIDAGPIENGGPNPKPAGDFNGDGIDDLVVERWNGPRTSSAWQAGATVVLGGPRVAAINANGGTARTTVINTPRSCSFSILTFKYFCIGQSITADPIGDFNGDGKDDLVIDIGSGGHRVLFGRTSTATINGGLPPQSSKIPLPTDTGVVFSSAAGDLDGDGFDDFTAQTKTPNAGFGIDGNRVVFFGAATPPATLVAGTTLRSPDGTIGPAVPIDDQNGDGKADLAVSIQQYYNDNFDFERDIPGGDDELFSDTGEIKIVTGVSRTSPAILNLTTYPSIPGFPLHGYPSGGRPQAVSTSDIDGDRRKEVRVLSRLATQATTADRLAPEFFGADLGGGIVLPPTAVVPADGVRRIVRLREAATVRFEYRTVAGALVGADERSYPSGTTRELWKATVGAQTLAAGTYTLVATPRDAAGNLGATLRLQVSVAGGPTGQPATVEATNTAYDAVGVPAGNVSYRLFCDGDVYWGGGTNGQTATLGVDAYQDPLKAGDVCVYSFWYLAAATPRPGDCSSQPEELIINGVAQTQDDSFAIKPGVNTIVFTRRCVPAPTPGPSDPVPGFTDARWRLTGNGLKSGASSTLTSAANQTGGIIWPALINPNGRTYTFNTEMLNGNGAVEGIALSFVKPSAAPLGGFPGTGGPSFGVGGLQRVTLAIDVNKNANDPGANFVGLSDASNASGLTWLQTGDAGSRFRGMGKIPIKVVATGTKVSVYVKGILRLERAMALPSPAYLAFSATTGAAWQYQTVSDVAITSP